MVPLPKGLLPIHVEKAIGYVEREAAEADCRSGWIDVDFAAVVAPQAAVAALGAGGLDLGHVVIPQPEAEA